MQLFKRSDVKIGGKSVPVRKITIAQWRELFGVVQTLPQLLISVITAPEEQRAAFVVLALEQSLDDVVRVTAILTGLDEAFVEDNAALDELVSYFAEMAKVNDFGGLLKNVKSVLSMGSATKQTTQDAD